MRKPQNLINTRQYGKTLRVEFTLTKLQEDLPEQESSRQITHAHKILTKATETKHFQFQTKISQADQHTKALQKSSKLKNKFRQSAVRQTFQTNLDNFYYLLKDEHVLFFYLLHSLSRTSQLKIQKLCHNPTKTIKCPQLSRQLTTSWCNRNTVHALTTYPTHPKFSKAIILKLSQKTAPQVKRPVIVAIHMRVNKIHVRNK